MRYETQNKNMGAISHRLRRLIMLIHTIQTCHHLRDKPLDVKHHHHFSSYDYLEDYGYIEYSEHRDIIRGYPKLEKALNWFNWI